MADQSGKTEREKRLAEALRSNLRRRKAARAPDGGRDGRGAGDDGGADD